jgi:hypothetical protein
MNMKANEISEISKTVKNAFVKHVLYWSTPLQFCLFLFLLTFPSSATFIPEQYQEHVDFLLNYPLEVRCSKDLF